MGNFYCGSNGSLPGARTAARAVAMMRHSFGTDADIQHERRFGQAAGYPLPDAANA